MGNNSHTYVLFSIKMLSFYLVDIVLHAEHIPVLISVSIHISNTSQSSQMLILFYVILLAQKTDLRYKKKHYVKRNATSPNIMKIFP